MTAVALGADVWLVGTADPESPAHTDSHDSAQYLIQRDGVGYLVDTGCGRAVDRMLRNVAEVIRPDALAGALVTHCHADHAGGAAELIGRGVRVFASGHTAGALATADEALTQLARAKRAGVYPADFALRPAPGIVPLEEVSALPLPWGRLTAIASPGHCDGHVAFLLEHDGTSTLFSGDIVFAGGLIAMQAIPDCRLDEYADTVIGLDELGIDRLMPGHGDAVLAAADVDIAAAASAFRGLLPPPNRLTAPSFQRR